MPGSSLTFVHSMTKKEAVIRAMAATVVPGANFEEQGAADYPILDLVIGRTAAESAAALDLYAQTVLTLEAACHCLG